MELMRDESFAGSEGWNWCETKVLLEARDGTDGRIQLVINDWKFLKEFSREKSHSQSLILNVTIELYLIVIIFYIYAADFTFDDFVLI